MELFKNYIFRLVVGANDHCCRNFITYGNKVYSIDDHCLDKDFEDLNNIKMKKDIKLKWNEYILKNKSEILELLDNWNSRFKNENMLKRINKLIEIIK